MVADAPPVACPQRRAVLFIESVICPLFVCIIYTSIQSHETLTCSDLYKKLMIALRGLTASSALDYVFIIVTPTPHPPHIHTHTLPLHHAGVVIEVVVKGWGGGGRA